MEEKKQQTQVCPNCLQNMYEEPELTAEQEAELAEMMAEEPISKEEMEEIKEAALKRHLEYTGGLEESGFKLYTNSDGNSVIETEHHIITIMPIDITKEVSEPLEEGEYDCDENDGELSFRTKLHDIILKLRHPHEATLTVGKR